MPIAVLDLDLTNLPVAITGLHPYTEASILIRYRGHPVGRTYVPVQNGAIDLKDCHSRMLAAASETVKIAWLKEYLDYDAANTIDQSPRKATIAICTRDRTEDLRRCLDALLQLPDDGQEILVIDNAPKTKDTQKLVALYPAVRYVLETRPGLDNARNRALQEARHGIVAFTDDDAIPDKNWLRAIVKNFGNPLVYCVTGLVMPLELETEAQEAFERYSPFNKGFWRVVHSNKTRSPLATGQVGAGASMALRKDIVTKVGWFDEALDAGTPTCSGGDHEMFTRILAAGYQIVYEPDALSWHRHRRSWKELRDTIYGYGVGVYSLFTCHLLRHGEFGVFKLAFQWFWFSQRHVLAKSVLKKPYSHPKDLILAELKGCLRGPFAYFASRKKTKRLKKANPAI